MWIGKGDHPVATRHPSVGGEFLNLMPMNKQLLRNFPSYGAYGGVPEGLVEISNRILMINA